MTKNPIIAVAFALGAAGLAGGCGGGYGTRPAAATSADTAARIVEMTDSSFAPNTIDLKVGQTVTFVDKDEIAHTATAAGVFDSGTLRQDATFDFKATKAGSFSYVCIFHPGMTGRINVSA